jgi:hypothetical protein
MWNDNPVDLIQPLDCLALWLLPSIAISSSQWARFKRKGCPLASLFHYQPHFVLHFPRLFS